MTPERDGKSEAREAVEEYLCHEKYESPHPRDSFLAGWNVAVANAVKIVEESWTSPKYFGLWPHDAYSQLCADIRALMEKP